MAYAFDTLGYSKRLRDAGIPLDQADAHAEAAREFVMAELVTRADLEIVRRELDTSIIAVRTDLTATRQNLEGAIERQTLRMTVRLGGLIAVAVAVLAAIIKL
jgi:hypothetical protein